MKATTKTILSAWQQLADGNTAELPFDPEIYSARSLAVAAVALRGRCDLQISADARTLAVSIHPDLRHEARQILGALLDRLLEGAVVERLGD
jgi:hypothetical protein